MAGDNVSSTSASGGRRLGRLERGQLFVIVGGPFGEETRDPGGEIRGCTGDRKWLAR